MVECINCGFEFNQWEYADQMAMGLPVGENVYRFFITCPKCGKQFSFWDSWY